MVQQRGTKEFIEMKRSYHGQMSESFVVGILLCLCGGFQDAYTYVCRDKVFANAQTGNIVLLGNHLAQMDWSGAVRYAVPILAFTAGIFVAQKVHFHFGKSEKIHWRQLVLLLEIVVLFAAGFFPTGMSLPANALISFSCAMQVDSFRKIRGNAMATTMCIGNLRSATDLWCAYTETKDKKTRQRSLQYYSFILVFAIGATLGGIVTDAVGVHAVWICCIGLLISFLIMFIQEEVRDFEKLEADQKLQLELGTLADELKDIGREIKRCLGSGKIEKYPERFMDVHKLEDVIQQIVSKVNRVVNETSPIVDFRLTDGSRVNVVLPPVSLEGPVVTIRKFPEKPMTIKKLVQIGSLSEEAAQFLEKIVKAGYNIFISGGTGSGKTTFLNALSDYIPQDERIITIEDAAELQIRNIPNLVRLEVRNANIEGKNAVTIRDLLKSSLRMRPDRIVLGEVRDAAACELLNAMNTGHDGSFCTGHANSSKDMLSRLETLVLSGMDIPILAIRNQIAAAVDIIIHLGRLRDKTRKVLEIAEVIGMDGDNIKLGTLFEFVEEGEDADGRVIGKLCRTEKQIIHTEKLQRAGIEY